MLIRITDNSKKNIHYIYYNSIFRHQNEDVQFCTEDTTHAFIITKAV